MLTDPREIEIISRARQKNVRDPARSRAHFERIFADFLAPVSFRGTRLLDLGPGQYDFAELARERGAAAAGIDSDPAVVELGRYKKLEVREGKIEDLRAEDFPAPFDGVFCKFSINAFWFAGDDEGLREHVRQIGRLVRPGGWSWIAPWNGVPEKLQGDAAESRRVLSLQAEAFRALGYRGFDLTEDLSRRYGVHGTTGNRALFLLNLEAPRAVQRCPPL